MEDMVVNITNIVENLGGIKNTETTIIITVAIINMEIVMVIPRMVVQTTEDIKNITNIRVDMEVDMVIILIKGRVIFVEMMDTFERHVPIICVLFLFQIIKFVLLLIMVLHVQVLWCARKYTSVVNANILIQLIYAEV